MQPTPSKIKSYKELLVWQKGLTLVKMVYKATKEFPADERFGLVSQTRRAAVSIPSNIAEGQSRRTTASKYPCTASRAPVPAGAAVR